MLLHINPTRQRGKRTGSLAGASGWYMTFFAAGVILSGRHLYLRLPDLLRSWSAGSGGWEATTQSGTQPVPKVKKEDG